MRPKQSIGYRQLRNLWSIGSRITADNYNFDIKSENLFILAPPLPPNMLSVNRRSTAQSLQQIGLNRQLSSRDISHTIKLILYKTLTLPVLLYDAEAWSWMLSTDAAAVRIFAKKSCVGSIRVSCSICSSATWTLCSILTSSGSVDSAMSFE